MAKTKQTKHRYHTTEVEEGAIRKMEEEKQKETGEEDTEESQEEVEQAGDTGPPPKKKKKDMKKVKSMTKEERQKRSEERKAQRKEKVLQRRKAQKEKAQEKVQLKREEHIEVLKRAKSLLRRTEAPSTAVREEDAPLIVDWHPEPSMSGRGTDPLETSLVEPGPQLVSLDPFEGEEEPVIHPTSVGAARVISQIVRVESNITKPLKIIRGKGLKSAGGKDPKSAGGKDLKSAGGKDPKSAGGKDPKSAGGKDPKSAGGKDPRLPAGGKPLKLSVGGKAPRKQTTPQKRKTPGSGSIRYVQRRRDIQEAREAGHLYADDPTKKRKITLDQVTSL